jgi:hypothetical protein
LDDLTAALGRVSVRPGSRVQHYCHRVVKTDAGDRAQNNDNLLEFVRREPLCLLDARHHIGVDEREYCQCKLYQVVPADGVLRQTSSVFAPAFCSRKIPMICSSVNRLGFMFICSQVEGLRS